MNNTKHTPTPWAYLDSRKDAHIVACDGDVNVLTSLKGVCTDADMARIVQCVNACAEDGPIVAALRHAHALASFARDVSLIPNQQKRHQQDVDEFASALRALGFEP